jgi:hypothetical protein
MPLGPPEADSDTDTQANSESFEFDLEANSEAHWQPPAAAATEKALGGAESSGAMQGVVPPPT